MNIKSKILILIFVVFSNLAFAQRIVDEESTFNDRIYFGGNFGLQLGPITFIDVSPLVGYMFNNQFSSGGGIIYNYYRDNRFGQPQSTNVWGSRFFSRYNFTQNLFGYGEFESLAFQKGVLSSSAPIEGNRHWVHSPFIGVGYIMRLGPRSSLMAMGLYNLNYRPDLGTPYPFPYVLRLGFIF